MRPGGEHSGGGRGGGGGAADIKSNNPHLTGGEIQVRQEKVATACLRNSSVPKRQRRIHITASVKENSTLPQKVFQANEREGDSPVSTKPFSVTKNCSNYCTELGIWQSTFERHRDR